MPNAMDTVTGFVTAPGATLTAWTMAAGDSLLVRNFNPAKRGWLIDFWNWNQVAGTFRLRSPKLHDNVQGLRYAVLANDVESPLAFQYPQNLFPQDALIAEQSGSAVGGNIETGSLLVWYEDLPGEAAQFIDTPTLAKRMVNMFTMESSLTPGAAGGYSGGQAFNANFDLGIANTYYALLGAFVTARCNTVSLRGPDTGNLRVSLPGEVTKRDLTGEWFVQMARAFAMPFIPIINYANKAGTTVDMVANQAATATTVTWIMAQLSPA